MSNAAAAILGAAIVAGCLALALLRPAPHPGRYQLQRAAGDVNLFLLDAETGRTWRVFVPTNGGEGPNWVEVSGPPK